jgi:phosphotransferase system HPr (HPr) family protein
MTVKKLTIEAANGLHARPAGDLVKLVKSFPGTAVSIATTAKKVNASSILSLLSLGLKKGTEIEITAEGPDEERVAEEIVLFLGGLEA